MKRRLAFISLCLGVCLIAASVLYHSGSGGERSLSQWASSHWPSLLIGGGFILLFIPLSGEKPKNKA